MSFTVGDGREGKPDMGWKGLIVVGCGWVVLTLYNYYYGNFFFIAMESPVLSLAFGIASIYQMARLWVERKSPSLLRIVKVGVFSGLLLLTYFRWWTHGLIETADWAIFSGARKQIVAEMQSGALPSLHPDHLQKLPFHFPPLAHGGNKVQVKVDSQTGKWTVAFAVFANFMDAPSIYRIYSDDPSELQRLEQMTHDAPSENWKLEDHWYRVVDESPW